MKYYQYLRGENQGKVIVLDYIDDVSNSEMVLYHFSDGFKCNEELIAPINDKNAYNEKKILAEVGADNARNIWKFDKSTIKMSHKSAVADDGQTYEAADPYFIGKTGEQLNKEKEAIKAIPPIQYYGNIEPIDHYRKSYKDYQLEQLRNRAIEEVEVKKENATPTTTMQSKIEDTTKVGAENPTTITHNDLNSSIPQYSNNSNNYLQPLETTQAIQKNKQPQQTLKYNEVIDVLMKTAKLNKAEISFTITLDLPDKSLIDVIRKNYSKEYVEDAYNYIIDSLDISDINSAIKSSLNDFYSNNCVNEASNDVNEHTINNDN